MSEKRFGLPFKGLIVSCYLESMQGCERQFIDSVAKLDEVAALRVEGAGNIKYSIENYTKPVIGLIKRMQPDNSYITATFEDLRRVEDAGANVVAIDSRSCNQRIAELFHSAKIPVMADIEFSTEAIRATHLGASIIATTFCRKAFKLLSRLQEIIPGIPINLEGGIETPQEITKGFQLGAKWVTVGKMINNPPTIIKFLMGN